MSHFVAQVTLYDVLDTVNATIRVQDYDIPDGEIRTSLTCSFTCPGTGESDPKKWIRDALMWAVEGL